MSILLFFIVLFILILVHELGHFLVAKKTDMRVDEFGIGFPPRLFGYKKGETLYSLNALPIGGFVRIFGEDLTTEAAGEDANRSFTKKSKRAQAAVLIAGVSMNIVFAWILFVLVFVIGVPVPVDESTAGDDARLMVANVLPDSPAARAGIPPHAEIIEVTAGDESIAVLTPSSFSTFTIIHSDEEITISYQVDDTLQTAKLTPETGFHPTDETQPVVGVSLGLTEILRYPIHVALYEGTVRTIHTLGAITVGITTLLIDAATFNADLSSVAGPVGIVGLVGDAAEFGFTSLLVFTAIISLNLAVINLLPFPALDGGRLLFVLIEAIRKKPINPLWAARANMVGFVLLLLLMAAVTFNDILRIV